jgi:hypothetical protein
MFTEDLTVFFQTGDFGVAATYDTTQTVNGIFDEPDFGQLGVAGTNPTFTCRAADVAANPTGKPLIVNAVTYAIRDIRPLDDGAVVVLELTR